MYFWIVERLKILANLKYLIKEAILGEIKLVVIFCKMEMKLGGKTNQLFKLSRYGFPIPLNIFRSYKSNNKGDIR